MKVSEVIKCGADEDTDPGRVSEGQEVHMGPWPACFSIILLFPASTCSLGCMIHRSGLIGLLGIKRKRAGKGDTQGRWRKRSRMARDILSSRFTCGPETPLEPSPGS